MQGTRRASAGRRHRCIPDECRSPSTGRSRLATAGGGPGSACSRPKKAAGPARCLLRCPNPRRLRRGRPRRPRGR
eukprot:2628710-Heterocapsa_arctica.AAC.1